MRYRAIIVAFLVTTFGFASTVEAQGTEKPFTKGKVTQAEYAQACEDNDMSVLNMECDAIAEAAFNTIGLTFNNRHDFADWMKELEVRTCPQETVRLARIYTVPNRRVDTNGWVRPLRSDEMCLYADNRAVLSLDCGNFIVQPFPVDKVTASVRPVYKPPVTRVDTVRLAVEEWPPLAVVHHFPEPLTLNIPEVRERSWLSRNWGWPVGILAAGAGACVIANLAFDECNLLNVKQKVVIRH